MSPMLFFDLDRTLLDHDGAQRAAALTFWRTYRSHVDLDANEFVRRWNLRAEHHVERYFRGEITFAEQRRCRLRELLENPTLPDDEADSIFARHLENYEAAWRLFDDVLPCLERHEHSALGVITNGDGVQQRRKLDRLGLTQRFRVIVISGEVGHAKPDARVFIEACQQADVEPSQATYVGDRLDHDAEAAHAAGLNGIWLDRANGELRPPHVLRITSLAELSLLD